MLFCLQQVKTWLVTYATDETYATQFLKTVAFCLSWGQEGILYTLQQSMNIAISFFVTFGGIKSILVNPILLM